MNKLFGSFAMAAAFLAISIFDMASAQTSGAHYPPPSGIVTVSSVTAEGIIKAVDVNSRTVTVMTTDGRVVQGTVNPAVGGLGLVKVGDRIRAKFEEKLVFSVVPHSAQTAPDRVDSIVVTSKHNELPAGIAAVEGTTTWIVVAANPSANTITLVSPAGGRVQTHDVVSSEGQAALGRVRPGDKLTITFVSYVFGAVVRE